MAVIPPAKLTYPYLVFTNKETMPVTVDLTCFARGVHITPDSDDAFATFCDPMGVVWTITIDFLQSLGAEGLDEALWSLGGPGVPITVQFAYVKETPGPNVGSVENPIWTAESTLAAWAVVDAGLNEGTEINMELSVIGNIVRDPDPLVTVP